MSQLEVKPGHKVDLKKYDADSTQGVPPREMADAETTAAAAHIGQLQDLLYANSQHSVLIILQGMDASGKDGTVRRILDNVNPTGVTVTSFKVPTPLEARHDFLWRCHEAVPPRGYIGVFNRSYYEEVLIVRVHADQFLPPWLQAKKDVWSNRFELINQFEKLLALNGTMVLKFFLHISKDEQRERFLARQKDPTKNWKLAAGDFAERQYWNDYQKAYEDVLQHTCTDASPWYVIPANRKWVRNYHISQIVEKTLMDMKLAFPKVQDKALLTMKIK